MKDETGWSEIPVTLTDEDVVAIIPGWSSYRFHPGPDTGRIYPANWEPLLPPTIPKWAYFVVGLLVGLAVGFLTGYHI